MKNALNENQNKIQLLETQITHLEKMLNLKEDNLNTMERIIQLFEDKINIIEQKNKELLLFRNINFN